MNQALQAAQQILTGLNDIQPIVSVKGLSGASTAIRHMKKNVGVVLAALTPVNPRLAQVLDSTKKDMKSSFKAMIEVIPFDTADADVTDEQILALGAAAETFVNRSRDYFSCKESYDVLLRHNATPPLVGVGYPTNSEGYHVD